MAFSLGVDIGTTYTGAAIWRAGSVQTAALGNRTDTVPSVLFLRDDGVLLIGEAASRRAVAEPSRQAREFKRRMGDDVPVLLAGEPYPAHELIGLLLRWTVDKVAEREGARPEHVVLTHPAGWREYRRDLLVEAAGMAGLTDVGLLPEPVAAATWYASQARVEPGSCIGIYDLGGGTFDASVVRKTDTGFELVGEPGGDDTVGGVDFDHDLLRFVLDAAGCDQRVLDTADPTVAVGLAQLHAAVIEAKETLSVDRDAAVLVALAGVNRTVTVTKAQFEALVRPRLLGTVQIFGRVVERAGVHRRLDAVLLVGGSSQIPLVAELLKHQLGVRIAVDAHPKYAVCLGAAIAAAARLASGPLAPGPAPAAPAPSTASPGPVKPPAGEPAVPTASQRPAAPVPAAPIPAAPVPAVSVPQPPAVLRTVDLAGTGLTGAVDVPIRPPRIPLARPVTDREPPVVVRTRDEGAAEYAARGRRTALVTVAAALVVAVVAGAVAVLNRGTEPESDRPVDGRSGTTTSQRPAAAGVAALTGASVAEPQGVDAMRAVAALPSGTLVSVGLSIDQHPRMWVKKAGQPWRFVPAPASDRGAVADVAVARTGGTTHLVAVGWTLTGSVQRPAVWLSATGEQWRLLASPPDLVADGLTELTAVVAITAGGFLAVGTDRREDKVDGDAAVFRSDDGNRWRRVPATGLDGTGPQEVRRVIQTADHRYVAVGAVLEGARRGAALWTSGDGSAWQPMASAPSGAPTLYALAQGPDGALLTCGALGSADRPQPSCWKLSGPAPPAAWLEYPLRAEEGSARPTIVYSVLITATGALAVGAAAVPSGVDAAQWSVVLRS